MSALRWETTATPIDRCDVLSMLTAHANDERDRRVAEDIERRSLIVDARAAGASWDDVAAALGVTATAARVRYRNDAAEALA